MHVKRIISLMLVLIFSVSHVWAAPSYMKNRADKVTWWNKVTDTVATIGKDDSDKRRIKRLRRAKRQQTRLRKARTKASKQRLVELGVIDDKKWWPF